MFAKGEFRSGENVSRREDLILLGSLGGGLDDVISFRRRVAFCNQVVHPSIASFETSSNERLDSRSDEANDDEIRFLFFDFL